MAGTFLQVQWLRIHASSAKDASSLPGRETKVSHVAWQCQKFCKTQWLPFTSSRIRQINSLL